MGMAMLWSKLDKMRRGTVAGTRVPQRQHFGVTKPSTKPIGSSTVPVDRHGFRGDTIVALPPHRHPMKALCLGDGDREAAARELARKLFKIRFADSEGRRRSASFLVQRRYAWRGYQVDAPAAIQPSRITLSAYDGDEVVATMSVGLDAGNDLFVNALFGDEVNSLRARGERCASSRSSPSKKPSSRRRSSPRCFTPRTFMRVASPPAPTWSSR